MKEVKEQLLEFKTKDLELQTRIALLESNNSQNPSTSNLPPIQISSQDLKSLFSSA